MITMRKEALLSTGSWIILEHHCSAGLITSREQKPTCPWIQKQRNEAAEQIMKLLQHLAKFFVLQTFPIRKTE